MLMAELCKGKWDVILTSDTLYSTESIPHLVKAIDQLLSPNGVCFLGAKRYYFGIGGSVAAFLDEVRADLFS